MSGFISSAGTQHTMPPPNAGTVHPFLNPASAKLQGSLAPLVSTEKAPFPLQGEEWLSYWAVSIFALN